MIREASHGARGLSPPLRTDCGAVRRRLGLATLRFAALSTRAARRPILLQLLSRQSNGTATS